MTVNVSTSPPDLIKSTTCLWVAPSTFTLFLQQTRRAFHETTISAAGRSADPLPAGDRLESRVEDRSAAAAAILHPLALHSCHVTRQHLGQLSRGVFVRIRPTPSLAEPGRASMVTKLSRWIGTKCRENSLLVAVSLDFHERTEWGIDDRLARVWNSQGERTSVIGPRVEARLRLKSRSALRADMDRALYTLASLILR